NILRPAFRKLFHDWENGVVHDWANGAENFPDLGDPTTTDPNTTPPESLSFGTFPAFVPPTPIPNPPGTADIIVAGDETGPNARNYAGDQHFTNIVGNGDGTADALELHVEGDVVLDGFVGGGGLTTIIIRAGGSITIADGATLSSRQVAADANHWN